MRDGARDDPNAGGDPPAERPPQPERPRSEPEIIAPGDIGRDRMRGPHGADPYGRGPGGAPFVFVDQFGQTHRFKVSTISPWMVVLVLLAVGLVAGIVLLLVLGVVLFWIPVLALLLAGLLAWSRLRAYWRGMRGT